MADEDEIDVLGDFSFNSCFAQNNQGIPSCSSREDTVHPQWLLDSTETNWYDKESKRSGPSRRLIGDKNVLKNEIHEDTSWSQAERKTLDVEMAKYGRNIKKISQAIKTKTEAEIQALIDAEYGIRLEPISDDLKKYNDQDDIPAVVQEEVVANTNMKKKVINPSVNLPKHPFRKKSNNRSKNSLLKNPNESPEFTNPEEIFYEDDLILGSTQCIGSELDMTDVVSRNIAKFQAKIKADKKVGNHRRKVLRNYDKGKPRNRSKEMLKSPQGRVRKDSSLSDDSVKSPIMQIVLGSGQALPVSEGEVVIKIEKKKDSEPESDIEIDVDSDNESSTRDKRPSAKQEDSSKTPEEPIAVPLRKFEPMPRRQKKINLDGGGGFTIMHTEAGDLYEVGTEPKKERQPKKPPIHLIRCKVYNAEKPAPYTIHMCVSCLILMDAHAHTSRGEVMGLAGGGVQGRVVTVSAYSVCAAAAGSTHCDMDPVSQSSAAEAISSQGLSVCGWHHSHPRFPCWPSAQDLATQRTLQRALEWAAVPLLGVITSQHWPPGRHATQYRCIRVEDDPTTPDTPEGYQLSVKLLPDITLDNVPKFVQELRTVLRVDNGKEFSVDMSNDVCPQANMTYLEKCISSISQHLRSAGYPDDDPVSALVVQGLRDVFR